jgi:hypothetical protein
MISIAEFCNNHGACDEGRAWARDNCQTMLEVWVTVKPAWLVWVATRKNVLSDKALRLFACFCARQNWHLLTDKRSRTAVEVAERYANGLATDAELSAAREAARSAAEAAARAAYSAAARSAAEARSAEAAAASAWSAAEAADAEAGTAAAWSAAAWSPSEARTDQATYLRSNCVPNFEE